MTSSKLHTGDNSEGEHKEEAWASNVIKAHLNSEADNLDFVVASKLKAARHRAVAQAKESSSEKESHFQWKPTLPLLSSVAVAALALFLGQSWIQEDTAGIVPTDQLVISSPPRVMEDLPMLSSNDDIEFFQSMELLEWMDSNSG